MEILLHFLHQTLMILAKNIPCYFTLLHQSTALDSKMLLAYLDIVSHMYRYIHQMFTVWEEVRARVLTNDSDDSSMQIMADAAQYTINHHSRGELFFQILTAI